MIPLAPNAVSMPRPEAVPVPSSIPSATGTTITTPPADPADPTWPNNNHGFVQHAGGSDSDGFTNWAIVAGGISLFGPARKLYLTGGGTLSGVEAAFYIAGTILQCTLGADTALSVANTTIFASIAMPPGTPSPLFLARYTRFSLQLIRPTGLPPFWQLEI